MNLSDLLKKELVRKTDADAKQAQELLEKAGKDLSVAKTNAGSGNYDWALAIAYNSMLSAGRALMAKKGYRPLANAHHLAIMQFCAAVMPLESQALVGAFNRYRVRRHDVVYGESDSVSKSEAEKAIELAAEFLAKIQKMAKE